MPRSALMIKVNGWYSANQRRPGAIECGGTDALLRKGRNTSGVGALLPLSGVLAGTPRETDTQVTASATAMLSPHPARHPARPASGGKARPPAPTRLPPAPEPVPLL